MARGRWYLPGMLYTGILEVPLRGIRKKVRDLALKNNLFPLLDLCCGPGTQAGLLGEAKNFLAPGGGSVLVDFERPWDRASRRAYLYVSAIERLAGRSHFRNGRAFFERGGLGPL